MVEGVSVGFQIAFEIVVWLTKRLMSYECPDPISGQAYFKMPEAQPR
jgi:hypothetical protein